MGWRDRRFVLGDRERDVVTRNGIFRAIALVEGRAAGTWALSRGRVQLDLWRDAGPMEQSVGAALLDEAVAVERYLKM